MNDSDTKSENTNEKSVLVSEILELQNTLEDLSHRVESVRDENVRLRYTLSNYAQSNADQIQCLNYDNLVPRTKCLVNTLSS